MTTKLAVFVAGLGSISAGYSTTRNLFDRPRALPVAALLSTDMVLMGSSYHGYAEPFLVLLFIVLVWTFVRGLDDSRYMLAFSGALSLVYLSKTILGWTFVLVGVIGLMGWWFYHVREKLWRDVDWLSWVVLILATVATLHTYFKDCRAFLA